MKTFAFIKPGSVRRNEIIPILGFLRFRLHFSFAELRLHRISPAFAQKLYAQHVGKSFFEALIAYTTESNSLVMVLEGAAHVNGRPFVEELRHVLGATDSTKAEPNTLRNVYGSKTLVMDNAMHASDSPEAAYLECELWHTETQRSL